MNTDCKSTDFQAPVYKFSHNVAVAIVPPEDCVDVWERISRIRFELRDPNFFRWPPHINLLYPFIEPIDDNVIGRLSSACQRCQPFQIDIQSFGTFGGKNRGVLWLDPAAPPALERLQASICEEIPLCTEMSMQYRAHMTVSHFGTLGDAEQAASIAKTFLPDGGLSFPVNRVCLLRRVGDEGQFRRVAEFELGTDSIALFQEEPKRFELMPEIEAEWTREERMKLKARRKSNSHRRRTT